MTDPEEVRAAAEALQGAAASVWAPAGSWHVEEVKSGVRAMPQKTGDGALPLAGRLPSRAHVNGDATLGGSNWWVVAGLGARGLLYHAWLGQQIAAAVHAQDETLLPQELRRWQRSPV